LSGEDAWIGNAPETAMDVQIWAVRLFGAAAAGFWHENHELREAEFAWKVAPF